MKYCTECGTKLRPKEHEREGIVPYCVFCEEYRFPIFNVAVSVILENPSREKIMLIQQYGRKRNILVAGYINKGESAEDTIKREVFEEVGLDVTDIQYNKSEYFEKSNTLMLNFSCTATSDHYKTNTCEVDEVAWFDVGESKDRIASGTLAKRFLLAYLEKRNNETEKLLLT